MKIITLITLKMNRLKYVARSVSLKASLNPGCACVVLKMSLEEALYCNPSTSP